MLTLTDSICRLGKVANNLEKHGDDDVTAFDVPATVELTGEQTNELLGDRIFSQRAWDTGTPGVPPTPAEGLRRCKPLELIDAFDDVTVEFTLRGKQSLTFEGCKLSKIHLELALGGTAACDFSIRLRPNSDREILQLLHHQKREVNITTSGGKVAVKKADQQELPLGQPAANDAMFDAANDPSFAEVDAEIGENASGAEASP